MHVRWFPARLIWAKLDSSESYRLVFSELHGRALNQARRRIITVSCSVTVGASTLFWHRVLRMLFVFVLLPSSLIHRDDGNNIDSFVISDLCDSGVDLRSIYGPGPTGPVCPVSIACLLWLRGITLTKYACRAAVFLSCVTSHDRYINRLDVHYNLHQLGRSHSEMYVLHFSWISSLQSLKFYHLIPTQFLTYFY